MAVDDTGIDAVVGVARYETERLEKSVNFVVPGSWSLLQPIQTLVELDYFTGGEANKDLFDNVSV